MIIEKEEREREQWMILTMTQAEQRFYFLK